MRYDLVVIGGGSGGVRAARIAASLGARVALVEARELGGTCVNRGCVPKKLLAYGARYGEHAADAARFGWGEVAPGFDWGALIRNTRDEVSRLNGIYGRILERAGVEVIRGRGVLADARTVRVGARSLSTDRVLVATGGVPWRPDIPGAGLAMVSDDLFEMDALPARMIVVGGGYIAVEFASILQGFGVDVTLLYRGPLFLRGFDVEARTFLAEQLALRGVEVVFDAGLAEIRADGAERVVRTPDGAAYRADAVLLAVGRRPNVAGLGLEEVGVELSEEGIPIDEGFETNVPGIHAVGDVADRGRYNHLRLTPVALAEGMLLARRLFGHHTGTMDYNAVPTAVFSNPNYASVGLSEEAAREKLARGRVYTSRFRPMAHTVSGREEEILVKLVVDGETDRVVGAHMVGPDAGEVIQGLAVAIRAGATKADFDRTIGIHPTAAEEFVTLRAPARHWGA